MWGARQLSVSNNSIKTFMPLRMASFTERKKKVNERLPWLYFNLRTIPDIGMIVRVFANGSGDLGSVPGRVIPKTQKMVLDASLLNSQRYKVRIKGKVEHSRERSSVLPYTLV